MAVLEGPLAPSLAPSLGTHFHGTRYVVGSNRVLLCVTLCGKPTTLLAYRPSLSHRYTECLDLEAELVWGCCSEILTFTCRGTQVLS